MMLFVFSMNGQTDKNAPVTIKFGQILEANRVKVEYDRTLFILDSLSKNFDLVLSLSKKQDSLISYKNDVIKNYHSAVQKQQEIIQMDSVALATSKYQNNNLKKEVSKAKNVSFLWKLYAILATSAVVYQTIK